MGHDQPVIIDVGATSTKQLIVGSIVLGGLGAIAVVGGLAGRTIVAVIIGAVFLLLGLLPVVMRKKAFRPHALARFAPHIYRGVHTTEGFMGLT